MNRFNTNFPALLAIKPQKETFNTYYFEDMAGIESAYEYRSKDVIGKTIVGFGAKADNLSDDMLAFIDKLSKRYVDNNITIKAITPKHSSVLKMREINPKVYTEVKFVPEDEYTSGVSIEAADDFVRIIDLQEKKGVIIDSKKLADTIKNIYSLIKI